MLVTLHFLIKGGQLGPRVGHAMFLDHQVMVPLRFWIIKLGPPVSDVTFSHHLMTTHIQVNTIYVFCWCGVCLFFCHISSSSNLFQARCWERPKMYPPPPELYFGSTIQTRSAARRAANDLVDQKIVSVNGSFPMLICHRSLMHRPFCESACIVWSLL